MSTHNIGFYEDLTKNIFELSSNIIKYAPCFFCCLYPQTSVLLNLKYGCTSRCVMHDLACVLWAGKGNASGRLCE